MSYKHSHDVLQPSRNKESQAPSTKLPINQITRTLYIALGKGPGTHHSELWKAHITIQPPPPWPKRISEVPPVDQAPAPTLVLPPEVSDVEVIMPTLATPTQSAMTMPTPAPRGQPQSSCSPQ